MKRNRKKLAGMALILALTAALSACQTKQEDASAKAPAPASSQGVSDAGVVSPESPGAESAAPPEETESNAVFGEFTTDDLDGNEVKESVFGEKKLTMVNIWGTFCGPCLSEMPELGELSAEYADSDFQIIGIVVDVFNQDGTYNQGQLDKAKEVVEKTGAAYTHLIPSPKMMISKIQYVSAIPETVFLDENGNQVGKSILGAKKKDQWKQIIEEKLEEVG